MYIIYHMLCQDLNIGPLLMLNKNIKNIFSYHAVFLIMLLQVFSLEYHLLFKICQGLAGVMVLYG